MGGWGLPRAVTRAMVRLHAVDAVVASVWVGMSWVLGLSQPLLLAVLSLLRLSFDHLLLRRLYGPVCAWLASEEPSRTQVRAADDALQRFQQRYVLGHALGWTAAVAGSTLLWAWSSRTGLGAPELYASVVFGIAMVAAPSAFMLALSSSLNNRLMFDMSFAVHEDGLDRPRLASSFRDELMVFFALYAFASICGTLSTAGSLAARVLRAQALTEERARVELAVLELAAGVELETLDPALELLDAPPPALETIWTATPDAKVVSDYDRAEGHARAAARTMDGRYIYAESTPEVEGYAGAFALFTLINALVIALLTALVVNALSRTLLDPLDELRRATRRMVDYGDMAAIGRVMPLRNDEIGGLIYNYNELLDIIEELSSAAQAVAGGDLRASLERPGDLHEAFAQMVEQLRAMVLELRQTAVEVASATGEIHAATRAQEQAAQRQTEIVQSASETLTSLALRALEISTVADELSMSAERSHATAEQTLVDITALEGHTRGIRELLVVIRDVASRSDLLALNGALEASRAGEAGRGFEIVAAEMRGLAERVTGSVGDAGARVEDIEGAARETLASTQQSRGFADETVTRARKISAATTAQSAETAEASRAAVAMAEFVASSAAGTSQTLAVADTLRERVAELERISTRFEL